MRVLLTGHIRYIGLAVGVFLRPAEHDIVVPEYFDQADLKMDSLKMDGGSDFPLFRQPARS